MKELDSFTVERLEEITELKALSFPPSHAESAALARIALAAKRAEPVAYMRESHEDREYNGHNEFSGGGRGVALYTTPQLNSPEIPEGWKLVPINPTAEMMAAAMECDDVVFDLDDDTIFCVQFDDIYAAMLAAAPEKLL
ncbi:hypothetical protein [Yersinia enterocolitica]|uniref:hypothetical protein n=1 Tax=Yersinia enterocolitica TaxID=630 RepID=UPI0009764A4B|nr:hypothetical protein [Yersinia enterocolitica]